jgi:hypothetical protein
MPINWGTSETSSWGKIKSLAGTLAIPASVALAPVLAKAIGIEIDPQTLEGQVSTAALAMAAGTAYTAAALQQNVKANDLVEHRKAEESEANRLANHDIAKAIGKTIATIIALQVGKQSQNSPWTKLANNYEATWVTIANTESLDKLGMLQDARILEAIQNNPDKPSFEAVGDEAFWREILALMAPHAQVNAAILAAAPEYAAVIAALDTRFCYEFYQVLKQDATDGGRAFPGIMLRGMGRALVYLERIEKRQADYGARLDNITQLLHDVIDRLAATAGTNPAGDYTVFRAWLAAANRNTAALNANTTALERGTAASSAATEATVDNTAALREVEGLLREWRSGSRSADNIKTTGNLAVIRLAPNQFFTGRTDELARLHAALAGGSVAIVHALTGEGGIGKTELAKVYALIYADTYDSAWWVDASSAALRGELVKVYERATGQQAPQNAPTDLLCDALVAKWKGTRPLVILDNVDDPANFTILSALPTARILATTRQHHKTLQGVEPFALGVLPIPDAVALMRKEIAKNRADVTDADLTAIATELDGHALAVALAGAYLANYPSYSATEVLAKLKDSKVGDVDPVADDAEHDALGLSYRRSVAASLSLSFAIPQVAAALPVLAAASFLHPTGITIQWLMAGTGWDKDKVIKAARTLATYSIIKHDKTISLHRLTQGVARSRPDIAGGEQGHAALTRLLDALIELFRWPGTQAEELLDHTKTPARLAAVAHAEAVIVRAGTIVREAGEGAAAPLPRTPSPAEAESAGELGAKAVRLRGEMAHRLKDAGQLADATRHIDAAIAWGESESPRDERELAIRYASRASIRQLRGDLAGAEADIKKSIDWGEAQSPRDERSLAIDYASRASIRQNRGDLAGAEADIKKSIDWGEAQSPRDERSLAIWYASRASIRQTKGDFAGAEDDIQKSIDWGEAQSPRDERSLAIWYSSRASIRQDRGLLKEAEADIQKSIDWGEAQSPRDERSLAIDYASRASIRQNRGDLAGAEADIKKSIDWGEAQSPRDERTLAIHYASRARILENQAIAARRDGDVDGAAVLFAKAKADIAYTVKWFETNLPSELRGIAIFRGDQARIDKAAQGE